MSRQSISDNFDPSRRKTPYQARLRPFLVSEFHVKLRQLGGWPTIWPPLIHTGERIKSKYMKANRWIPIGLVASFLFVVYVWLPGFAQSGNNPRYLPMIGNPPTPTFTPTPTNTPTPEPVGPPQVSPSYYMTTLDPQTVTNEGCNLGKRDMALPGRQDSVVVLAFGYPQQYPDQQFGARGFAYPAQPATTAQIAAAVENFGYGYWKCTYQDYQSHLRIGIGTSNYPGDNYSSVTSAHGKAWAEMVNAVNDWFVNSCTRSCDGQVDAVGASDIELAWNKAAPTTDWINGYASAARYPLYNFGAVEGCPWLAKPTYTCAWGNLEAVWYVIWGASVVQPVPEIYLTSGINAEQWYLMSVYSYNKHGEKIQFVGPMSEHTACLQRGGCTGTGYSIDNLPADAWWQLYLLLNSDLRTDGELLRYSTDIQYLGE